MEGSSGVDKENQGFPNLQSLPVIRKQNVLKRAIPFGSDNTNIKRRKKDLPTYLEYIHHSKWIADNYFDLQLIGKGLVFILLHVNVENSNYFYVNFKNFLYARF